MISYILNAQILYAFQSRNKTPHATPHLENTKNETQCKTMEKKCDLTEKKKENLILLAKSKRTNLKWNNQRNTVPLAS